MSTDPSDERRYLPFSYITHRLSDLEGEQSTRTEVGAELLISPGPGRYALAEDPRFTIIIEETGEWDIEFKQWADYEPSKDPLGQLSTQSISDIPPELRALGRTHIEFSPSGASNDAGPGRYYIASDRRFVLMQDEAGDWKIEPNPAADRPRTSPPDQ